MNDRCTPQTVDALLSSLHTHRCASDQVHDASELVELRSVLNKCVVTVHQVVIVSFANESVLCSEQDDLSLLPASGRGGTFY